MLQDTKNKLKPVHSLRYGIVYRSQVFLRKRLEEEQNKLKEPRKTEALVHILSTCNPGRLVHPG